MRKGMHKPLTVNDTRVLRMEIASELGITDLNEVEKDDIRMHNAEINRKLVERYGYNFIGFK